MNISWYPLQLFVRRLELIIPLVVSFAISVGLLLWVAIVGRTIKEPVFLHYTIELGVDAAGSLYEAFALPILLIIIVLAFTALTNALILVRRPLALVVAYTTPAIILLGAWCVYLMLRVNGAV